MLNEKRGWPIGLNFTEFEFKLCEFISKVLDISLRDGFDEELLKVGHELSCLVQIIKLLLKHNLSNTKVTGLESNTEKWG